MVVVITGASSGFGRACALAFAAKGAKIIATARREEKLRALQQEIGTESCAIVACDVVDTCALGRGIASALRGFGLGGSGHGELSGVDVLVNNAGLALGLEPAHACKIEDWEQMIAVNITALVRLTHKLLPAMVARKKGHIINIGSIAGSYPYPGGSVYGASKAFVKQFSLNLRADLYDKNIRVSDIEPGLAGGSEFSLVRFKGDKARADSLYKDTMPLTPEDIAQAVCFVAYLPEHVNINRLEMMPTTQAPAALNVHKARQESNAGESKEVRESSAPESKDMQVSSPESKGMR